MQCPICADDMSLARYVPVGARAVGLGCCGQLVCQECLYRHIQSIFTEARTGQGRFQCKCPVGCGAEVSDASIRACLKRQYPQGFLQKCLATCIMYVLNWMGWFHVKRQDPLQTSRYYESWWYWTHSRSCRQALMRYEQWSVSVALRDCSEDEDKVVHCPAPDCGYTWVTPALYRHKKWEHERKSYPLWYTSPKPDQSNPHWCLAEYVHIDRISSATPEPDSRDGRRMVCANCHVVFCGLCRSPWTTTGRRTHRGKACKTYRNRHVQDADYAFVGLATNTRSCPSCSMRTSRIDGCNHMTCPCGKEWCYVCESSWSVRHYACVDPPPGQERSSYGCTIS